MKRFRLLRPDEIECRVSTCNQNGVSILLYKTARTDADLLDETVGCENWVNDFKVVDGTLYGGIGVDYGKGMIWKWDAGTESYTEKEKGRASDAFKRAGFKHGIGRELYSAPFIWITAQQCNVQVGQNGKHQCYDDFVVSEIGYDDMERINQLVITVKGAEVFRMGRNNAPKVNDSPAPQKAPTSVPAASEEAFKCEACGKDITPKVYSFSKGRYGKPLCMECQKKQ